MKMEVSNKDLIVLKVALTALVAVLMIRLAIVPAIADRETKEQALETAQGVQEQMQQQIDAQSANEERIRTGRQTLAEVAEPYYAVMENRKVDELLTGLALQHGLFPASLSISESEYGVPDAYLYAKNAGGQTLGQEANGSTGESAEDLLAAEQNLEEESGETAETESGAGSDYAASYASEETVQAAYASLSLRGNIADIYALIHDIEHNYEGIMVRSFQIHENTYLDMELRARTQTQLDLALAVYMCSELENN